MKITFIDNIYIIAIAFLCSCSSMYIPSTVNAPLFEEKGEAQFEVAVSSNSVHINSNYAFSNNYALRLGGNFSYGNLSNHYDIFTNKERRPDQYQLVALGEYNHMYGEFGIGRFNLLRKKLKLEVFSGLGYGVANDKEPEEYKYDVKYSLFFLQGNLGVKFKYVELGGSLKLSASYFSYSKYYIPDHLHNTDAISPFDYETNFSLAHIEPHLFMKLGKRRLKMSFNLGYGFITPLSTVDSKTIAKWYYERGYINTTNFHGAIGISYKISSKIKKQTP